MLLTFRPLGLLMLTASLFLVSTCPALAMEDMDNTAAEPAPRSAIQRLNQLRQEQPRLYMPTRFILGQEQELIVKAQPNRTVKLFFSPEDRGYTSDDGVPLSVGNEVQVMESVTNEKGVAVFTLPIPEDETLHGHRLYVDGYLLSPTQSADEVPQPTQLVWVDNTGRKTQNNAIPMLMAKTDNGPMILPNMPGLGGDVMRRIGTYQDIYKGGDRLKDMVDDGSINNDTVYDRNTFIRRPDGTGGIR